MFMTILQVSVKLSGVEWLASSAAETTGSLKIGSPPEAQAPKSPKKSFLRVCVAISWRLQMWRFLPTLIRGMCWSCNYPETSAIMMWMNRPSFGTISRPFSSGKDSVAASGDWLMNLSYNKLMETIAKNHHGAVRDSKILNRAALRRGLIDYAVGFVNKRETVPVVIEDKSMERVVH